MPTSDAPTPPTGDGRLTGEPVDRRPWVTPSFRTHQIDPAGGFITSEGEFVDATYFYRPS